MRLTTKEAAIFAKVSRPTIYAKLKSGELSKDGDGLFDVAELLRVFGNPDNRDRAKRKKRFEAIEKPIEQPNTSSLEVELLKEKIRFLETNLADARNREEWLKGQVEKLTESVKMLESPKIKEDKEKKSFFFHLFSRKK